MHNNTVFCVYRYKNFAYNCQCGALSADKKAMLMQ